MHQANTTVSPGEASTSRARETLQRLSVVIPARDEAGCIASTVEHLHLELQLHGIPHEIVVVDDGSTDDTWGILTATAERIAELVPVQNPGPHGFGRAIQKGLASSTGDAIVIMMADESDDCRDVVRYWNTLRQGYDCVFGSRFMKQGGTVDYPPLKWIFNRAANLFIRLLFGIGLNDTTNAFKAYRREVIEGCGPILSPHFNITVELPLKAIVRGYSWTTIPITWRNRRTGVAKLKIREMGSRYLFIVAYVWLEKYFSRGDYRKSSETTRDSKPSDPEAESLRNTVPILLAKADASAHDPTLGRSHRFIGRAALAVGMLSLVSFIGLFGVNIPVADDWDLLHTSLQWHEQGIDMRSLLAPHNEHCVALPRLIQHAVLAVSGGNFRALLFVNGLLCLATLWIVIDHVRRLPLPAPLLACILVALPLLLTSWCQWQNFLWAFQTPWFLLPLVVVTAAICMARSRSVWQAWAAAGAAMLVGGLSMSNGLLMGWALLPAMILRLRGEPRTRVLAAGVAYGVTVVAATAVGAWLIAGSSGPQGSGLQAMLAAPAEAVRCGLAIIGSPFDARDAFLGRKSAAVMIGAVSLAVGVAAAAWTSRLPMPRARTAAPGLALMAYGLLSIAAVVIGRLTMMSANPIESRYLTLAIAWHVGVLMCLACGAAWLDEGPSRRACRRITTLAAVAATVTTLVAMPFFLSHGRNMRQAHRERQSVHRNANSPAGRAAFEAISGHYGADRLLGYLQRMESAGIAHPDYSPPAAH